MDRFWAAWIGRRCSFSGLSDGLAGFEQVPHYQRNREPIAYRTPASERQRDNEPRFVHAIQQPPEAVAHPDDLLAGPVRLDDHALETRGRIVVVTHQHRLAALPYALGAADDERRRSVQGETARGDLIASRQLYQPLVRLDELGHVLIQTFAAGRQIRAGAGSVA